MRPSRRDRGARRPVTREGTAVRAGDRPWRGSASRLAARQAARRAPGASAARSCCCPRSLDWATAGGALPARLAARPVPGARLAEPRGRRAHLEFVVPAAEAGELPGGSPTSACPRHGGCGAAGASSPGRAPSRSRTFLGRIGASASLLELEARQVARTLRGELNRVLNAESANLQRSVGGRGPAARGDRRARGRRPARASSHATVRAVAEARRETPEASLSEIADAARPPPLGRPARARPPRAPGPPRRRGHGSPARHAGRAGRTARQPRRADGRGRRPLA